MLLRFSSFLFFSFLIHKKATTGGYKITKIQNFEVYSKFFWIPKVAVNSLFSRVQSLKECDSQGLHGSLSAQEARHRYTVVSCFHSPVLTLPVLSAPGEGPSCPLLLMGPFCVAKLRP